MRLFSYLSIIIGILLVVVAVIWDLSGIVGYSMATIGVFLSLIGIMVNKKAREFIVNLIINFF